eukprot:3436903-Pleurochrysis_carterae.AAC.1
MGGEGEGCALSAWRGVRYARGRGRGLIVASRVCRVCVEASLEERLFFGPREFFYTSSHRARHPRYHNATAFATKDLF